MEARRIAAVLGPTNTGKTHFAVERMLGHRTGAIGLPLRLLAREVYDRVVTEKGRAAAALVTGEEKIVPAGARYFVCTVESMPMERDFDFLAVDEVQLAADPERGHVFTDRLLRARGISETLFLGSETIRPLLRRLVPGLEFIARPRLSTLSFAGHKKLSRLPARSAVVSFSAQDVYGIGEMLRRHRGGAAVVLGALSPRTRNAQVALFENGEVDYLVATDAIGMGLNLNVDHIAFAAARKFDGNAPRDLAAHEVAQIAGRAGRYLRDGTFGATLDCPEFGSELVENVEAHRFKEVGMIFWRNTDLDFRSAPALLNSLKTPPPAAWRRVLIRPRRTLDQDAFATLSAANPPQGPDAVRLLWEVCQIPDFRKTMSEAHTRLLGRIHQFLAGPNEVVPTDWIADQIARLDRTQGDIDMLAARIAHVRTWTYVCHHGDWVPDSAHWQESARAVEDRLSDALHDRLTQRFVDRRRTVLYRRLGDGGGEIARVETDGEVVVDGHGIGRLRGFRFIPDSAESGGEARLLRTAAQRSLRHEIAARASGLIDERHGAFALDPKAQILWRGDPVARLVGGRTIAAPRLVLIGAELLDGIARATVEERLKTWLAKGLERGFAPLRRLEAEGLRGPARGLSFQVIEGLGAVPRRAVEDQLVGLAVADRKELRRRGLRFGTRSIFLPAMLRPERAVLASQLWALHRGLWPLPEPPAAGLVSVDANVGVPEGFYAAGGYRVLGTRAVRIDMIERLMLDTRRLARRGPIEPTAQLRALVGCRPAAFDEVMTAIGFRKVQTENGPAFEPLPPPKRRHPPRRRNRAASAPAAPQTASVPSAFAALARHPVRSGTAR